MDDKAEQVYREPTAESGAGGLKIHIPLSPYERFIESEGVPIYDGRGFTDVRDLKREPWARLGGKGCYLCLDGATQLTGIYVIEVPPGGVIEPARHMFENHMFVLEGIGTTEIWTGDGERKRMFEWSQGSLFAIPLNAKHRLVNGSNRRALLICGNNAPPIFNLFDDVRFMLENDYRPADGIASDSDYFEPPKETLAAPETGRAIWKSRVLPDIVNCELPLDNHRAPGFRRMEPRMGGRFFMFIGEYPSGRYSTAHHHESGAVLLCLKGSGYTINWPIDCGMRPWEAGHGDKVEWLEYGAGGIVSAAPGGGNWFHQHFGDSKEPMRSIAFIGGLPGQMLYGSSRGGKTVTHMNAPMEAGGQTINYPNEDPFIRQEYARRLAKVGVEMNMPERLYK
jgi:mannose-6-phosphate isomerase-like protein (cupin superfamily)